MLMRIIRIRAKPSKWLEFEQEFFNEAPDMHGVPGLRARWILQDLDDREAGFVVRLWDSKSDVIAFEHAAERSHLLTQPLPGELEFHLCEICSAWIAPESSRINDH